MEFFDSNSIDTEVRLTDEQADRIGQVGIDAMLEAIDAIELTNKKERVK